MPAFGPRGLPMNRRQLFRAAAAAAATLAVDAVLGQAARPGGSFQVGIAPHTSARVILEMYQPLRVFLEKSLARPVEIVTAPDFTEFARRGMEQQYDLAVTTGHLSRLSFGR